MGTVQLRRGLPRVPGGDAWPPAGVAVAEAPVVQAQAAQEPPVVEPQAAQQPPVVESQATQQPPVVERARPEAARVETFAPTTSVVERARPEAARVETHGAAAPVALRRGLPRVAGGEPWPPAEAAAASVAVAAVAAPAVREEASAAPQVIELAGTTRFDSGAHARPRSTNGGMVLRRGLPRVAGGEAWPPADALRAAPAIAAPSAPAAPETVIPAASAPAPAPAKPGPDVSVPLPFTPSVYPGAAPRHPAPASEPKRVGPFTRTQWAGAVIVGGLGVLFAAGMVVLAVRVFVSLPFMVDFLHTYPGQYALPASAPVGFPVWLNWQHFLNVFFLVLIVRTGLGVRNQKRPTVFWTPRGQTKRKVSLTLWTHQALDTLWILNGVVFVVLLFATGQWMRLVPTSWTVIPNAFSAALQYASLNWPHDDGWINYNSLQQLTYFGVVFLLAPLAILTGVRMSTVWPKNAKRLSTAYPVEWARAVHFPVMLVFVVFVIVHVFLVFATGALRNLNHMYGASDAVNWVGFWWFAASLLVIAAGWAALRPLILAPIARLFGTVSGR